MGSVPKCVPSFKLKPKSKQKDIMETAAEKVNGKIIIAASHELIGTLAEIMKETEDSKQYAAAGIMLSAALGLRDTVKRPDNPALFSRRMDGVIESLDGLNKIARWA